LRPSLRALLTAVAFISAACTSPPAAAPRITPTDTLFYVSARAREEGREQAKLADSLEYGLVFTARPAMLDPTADGARIDILDSLIVTRDEFVARLAARIGPAADSSAFAVFYTHGYGTSLHNLWEHSALARIRARSDQPWVVFSWPSIGSGIAWPRDGDVLTTAYRADSTAAVASRGAFAEALRTSVTATGNGRLLLIAHSLGGQMVGETLRENTDLRAMLVAQPLRAVAFVSPDIELQHFGTMLVPALRPLTKRLLLYASADDRVLMMSQRVNRSRRAGRIAGGEPGAAVFPGLESVDMTEGRHANSWLVNTFGTRHALRRKSAALFDLVHVVGGERSARCREQLGTARRLAQGSWRLTDTTLPPPSAVAGCERY
jgi:pimeloyl-ACP methyl ester carboxylesterase